MKWTVHGRRTVYESEWVNVTLEDVELPGGRRLEHHVLRMPRQSVAVVVFDQDTPLELITELRPDVLVKGGDYSESSIVGARDVRSWGGTVAIIPLTPGHSTTSTIERLRGH